jgi:hypothetical protein
MKKLLLTTSLLVIILILQSCATILHGSRQEVGFESQPTNATVIIDGQKQGATPLTVKLKRKHTHTIKFKLNGYEPYGTTLTRKVSGWVAGNLIFGAIPGLVVDLITGGMYILSPDQVKANLKKNGMSMTNSKHKLYITVTLNPNPHWQKIGSLKPITAK